MPSERVSMYRIREVLRLSAAGLTVRQVAAGARLSIGAVSKYLKAARAAGIEWPVPEAWDDVELERRVYGAAAIRPSKFVMPACAAIHQELKRHRHVTLQLLWEEYRAEHGPAAYSYSEFCTHYRRWKRHAARSMRRRSTPRCSWRSGARATIPTRKPRAPSRCRTGWARTSAP